MGGRVLLGCCALYCKPRAVSVPFVGCESYGQLERSDAPRGTSKSVEINPKSAGKLACYETATGLGVLAPRGWHCEGAWGSGGGVLYVGPGPIMKGSSRAGVDGPVIAVTRFTSAASGKWEIAEIMLRVYPAYKTLAAEFLKMMDRPFPEGPYPTDSLKYRGKRTVEFVTPPLREGLGNFDSYIGRSDQAIRGAVILTGDLRPTGDGPDLMRVAVRLTPELAGLTGDIVDQFERANR